MTNKNKFITVNGHKLNYKIINSKYNVPIKSVLVFLHDGLGSIQQWGDFPESLSNATVCLHYCTIGMDMENPKS